MTEAHLTRRREDAITPKTPVSLGFVLTLASICGSVLWGLYTYLDNRISPCEKAVVEMSGEVHQMKGEMDMIVLQKYPNARIASNERNQ